HRHLRAAVALGASARLRIQYWPFVPTRAGMLAVHPATADRVGWRYDVLANRMWALITLGGRTPRLHRDQYPRRSAHSRVRTKASTREQRAGALPRPGTCSPESPAPERASRTC